MTPETFNNLSALPEGMTKLEESYFARESEKVAKGLLGRELVIRLPNGNLMKATLREIAAYDGGSRTMSDGAYDAPATLSLSTKFGKKLMDISTGRKGHPSCITIRGADITIDDKVTEARGPGNVTKALSITADNASQYNRAIVGGPLVWIQGAPTEQSKIKKAEGNSRNCVGFYRI